MQITEKNYGVKNICRRPSHHGTDFSTVVSSSQEKDRIIYVYKGASQDLEISDFSQLKMRAKWFYLASLMGKSFQAAKKIAEMAKHKKIKLLFNPSLYLARRGKNFLKLILQSTTLLVLNQEEAQALLKTKQKSPRELLNSLQKLGPPMVVITNGEKRIHALNENHFYSLAPPKVKVVSTVGAGDAFSSGLLAGIIKNYSFEDALRLGVVNSVSVIQHLGAKNKLLSEKEARQSRLFHSNTE